MPSSRSFALLLLLSLSALPRLTAAEPDIRGRVLDRSGAVVAGASVTLRETRTGAERQAATDERGEFLFASVTSGRYVIVALAPGFAPAALDVDPAASGPQVTLTLDAAPVSELVTVRGDADARVISTATKLAASPLEIPQTIDSVPAPLLREQAATSMQDALRNVTGVSPNLGEGRRDQFLIRGFSATTDVLVDGVRDDALYYRDLSTLERVEVLKGPASALFGRGSSGGVINRVTKKPRFDQDVNDLSVMAGGFDTRRLTFDFGRSRDDRSAAFRVAGAWEDSGSFRDYAGLSRVALAPSFTAHVSPTTTVTTQVELLHDRRVPDRGIPSLDGRPAAVRISQYYGAPGDDYIATNVVAPTVGVERQFARGWIVRTVARAAWYDTTFSNTQPMGITRSAQGIFVKRSQYNAGQNQTNLFSQTELVAAFRVAGIDHVLLTGIELGDQRRAVQLFNGTAPDVALVDPILTSPRYSSVASTDTEFTGTTAGIYVQDQIALGARWKALLGVRGDRYAQALDDRTRNDVDLSRVDRTWSPRGGLVFQPARHFSLYGTVGRSFQPSGESLSLAVNAAQLGPEQSRNVEGGAKALLLGGRVSATASLFRIDRTNIKTTDPLDTTRLVLVGRQRTNGAELSIDGSVTPRWNVHAGYAWLDARVLRSNSVLSGVPIEGNQAGLVPEHSATLWSTFKATSALTFGGGLTSSSSRFTSNDNLVTLPSFTRVDAAATYRFGRYEVALNLRNALDTRYYESAGGDFQIYPGAPRNALVTVRYGF